MSGFAGRKGTVAINHDLGIPAYVQIEQKIRLGIAQGVWKVGDYLPTEEQLCATFGVSRGPVRQAMARLVQDGIVLRERRRGTRVITGVDSHGLIFITPYRAIEAAGMTPSNRVLARGVMATPPEVAERWPGVDEVVYFERVIMADDDPVTYGLSYFPKERFYEAFGERDMSRRAVIDVLLQEHKVEITRVDQSMELTRATERDAELLAIPAGSGCVAVTLWQWAGREPREPVEYAVFRLAPDKSRFLVSGLLQFSRAGSV